MAVKQPDTTIYAYVRCQKVMSRAKLAADTRHAARDDGNVRRRARDDADPECRAMGWRAGVCPELGRPLEEGEWLAIPAPEPVPAGAKKSRQRRPVPWVADLTAAVDERMAETGAQPHWRTNQAFALAIGVGISRQWIEEAGNPHDPQNPRNVQHRDEALKWLTDLFGAGLIAMRADCDEYGAGWIDAYVLPILDLDQGGRPNVETLAGTPGATPEPKPTVAVTKALSEINEKYGYSPRARPFVGLVEDWHTWAAVGLDYRLQRGTPAKISGARHVRADQFRAEVEAAENAAREAEAKLADLTERQQKTLERIQADHDLARRIRDAARNIQNAAQIIQNARNTLPDELLSLLEDPDIADTLAHIAGVDVPDLPDMPAEIPQQRRREDDEPGGPG